MKTKVIRVDAKSNLAKKLEEPASAIACGKLVAFPTETVYGLGVNALDDSAAKNAFKAKGRPSDNPAIVHIASKYEAFFITQVSELSEKLMDKFWPGPLTLVMKGTGIIPSTVTGGLETVAVRMPAHPVALALIEKAGVPIAAPSANTSGRPSPTSAQHVLEDLKGKIDYVIDGGKAHIGVESTVLDVTKKTPMLLRPGKVTIEQIEKVVGKIAVHNSVHGKLLGKKETAKAPGMKYRHYAPRAKVVLVEGSYHEFLDKIAALRRQFGSKVGVISSRGRSSELIASELFSRFREFDKKGCKVIVVHAVDEKGMGLALMNRLRKAASAKAS